jgi:uncharacterized protein
VLTSRNVHFWTSGATGCLELVRCQECGYYLHPPAPVCWSCRSMHVAPEPVSGRGTVYAFTINRYQWFDNMEPPYVVALVALAEQPDLRLLTNIVECPVDAVYSGMEVEVVFSQNGDVFVPLFRPVLA